MTDLDVVLSNVAVRTKEVMSGRPVYLVEPYKLKDAFKRLIDFFGPENVYLSTITAIDKPQEKMIEVSYFINIISERRVLVLRCRIDRNAPRLPSLIEFTGLHSGELETYDLFGVVFEGNPYLKRGAFVSEDLVKKNVYPLRKG